ncbi:MAG: hypothetical protein ACPG8W_12070 [Candidatus Promineifilaceae bacterium]
MSQNFRVVSPHPLAPVRAGHRGNPPRTNTTQKFRDASPLFPTAQQGKTLRNYLVDVKSIFARMVPPLPFGFRMGIVYNKLCQININIGVDRFGSQIGTIDHLPIIL